MHGLSPLCLGSPVTISSARGRHVVACRRSYSARHLQPVGATHHRPRPPWPSWPHPLSHLYRGSDDAAFRKQRIGYCSTPQLSVSCNLDPMLLLCGMRPGFPVQARVFTGTKAGWTRERGAGTRSTIAIILML